MPKIKTLFRYLRENPLGIIEDICHYGYFRWIPDKLYLKMMYLLETGKKLNLDNPRTYNEKLQWIKLYDRKPLYTKIVDKFEVRKYVADMIGEKYLIKLIGLYNSVDEIDWAALPNAFALKCTHGSGSNIICRDKSSHDIKTGKIQLRKWMKQNWFWVGREWPYRNIMPRIICEELLTNNYGEIPEDYKVLCFNGKAKMIQVQSGRFVDLRIDFYDVQWNKTDISITFGKLHGSNSLVNTLQNSEIIFNKPQLLEEMLQLSEILSQNTYHTRVDWYIVENKLYFGEITFFQGSGFLSFGKEKDEIMFGDWINLRN